MFERVSFAAFMVLCAANTALMAAEPTEATVGDKVRIRFERGRKVGMLRGLDERTLSLEELATGITTTYPLSSVLGAEVNSGSGSRGRNAKRGALIGGGIGIVVGAVYTATCHESEGCGGLWIPIAGGVLGVMGAGTGALIGTALPPGETWRPAKLSGVRFSLEPVPRGARVRVAIDFRKSSR